MFTEEDLLNSEVLTQEKISEIMLNEKLQEACSLQEDVVVPFLQPKELQLLIKEAQNFNQSAIDYLCKAFKPLIRAEARRTSVYNALGEDAENTAWLIFLELIQRYKGDNYLQLPGLIRIYLHFGLLHALHQEGCLLDCEAIDGSADFADTVADKRDHIEDSNMSMRFREAMGKLTAAQRKVVAAVDLNNISVQTFSAANKCSCQNSYKTRMLALNKLRRYFD